MSCGRGIVSGELRPGEQIRQDAKSIFDLRPLRPETWNCTICDVSGTRWTRHRWSYETLTALSPATICPGLNGPSETWLRPTRPPCARPLKWWSADYVSGVIFLSLASALAYRSLSLATQALACSQKVSTPVSVLPSSKNNTFDPMRTRPPLAGLAGGFVLLAGIVLLAISLTTRGEQIPSDHAGPFGTLTQARPKTEKVNSGRS